MKHPVPCENQTNKRTATATAAVAATAKAGSEASWAKSSSIEDPTSPNALEEVGTIQRREGGAGWLAYGCEPGSEAKGSMRLGIQ